MCVEYVAGHSVDNTHTVLPALLYYSLHLTYTFSTSAARPSARRTPHRRRRRACTCSICAISAAQRTTESAVGGTGQHHLIARIAARVVTVIPEATYKFIQLLCCATSARARTQRVSTLHYYTARRPLQLRTTLYSAWPNPHQHHHPHQPV